MKKALLLAASAVFLMAITIKEAAFTLWFDKPLLYSAYFPFIDGIICFILLFSILSLIFASSVSVLIRTPIALIIAIILSLVENYTNYSLLNFGVNLGIVIIGLTCVLFYFAIYDYRLGFLGALSLTYMLAYILSSFIFPSYLGKVFWLPALLNTLFVLAVIYLIITALILLWRYWLEKALEKEEPIIKKEKKEAPLQKRLDVIEKEYNDKTAIKREEKIKAIDEAFMQLQKFIAELEKAEEKSAMDKKTIALLQNDYSAFIEKLLNELKKQLNKDEEHEKQLLGLIKQKKDFFIRHDDLNMINGLLSSISSKIRQEEYK